MTPFAIQETEAVKSAAEMRLPLWGEFALSDPVFLTLFVLVVIALGWGRAKRRHVPGHIPALPGSLPRTTRQRFLWLPNAFQALALILAVLALARPLRGSVELTSQTEGIDIALLLDRSSSMNHPLEQGGRRRFDIAKAVIGDFAIRRMTDQEGAADKVGLIGFAGYTQLLLPFTLDADAMRGVLEGLDIEERRELDGTGIGIAIAKAVDVLRGSEAKSRIVVLLTDGEETIDVMHPLEAAQVAAERGVKVYTIFAGPKTVVQLSLDPRQPRRRVPVPVGDLPKIAEITGGRFYHAEEVAELEDVYAEIESLERTERETTQFAEHFDLYPRMLIPAFIFYMLSVISFCTWARRLP